MKLTCSIISFFLVINCCWAQSYTQAQADSAMQVLSVTPDDTNKVKTIFKICNAYYKSKPAEVMTYASDARKISLKENYKRGIAESELMTGVAHRVLANFDSASFYILRGIAVYKQINDRKAVARAMSTLGLIESSKGNYTEALKILEESRSLSEEVGDSVALGKSLVNIALNYYHLKDYEKALKMYDEALIIQQKVGDMNSQGNISMNVGLIYDERKNYDEALRRYYIALETYKKLGNKGSEAVCYTNIANTKSSQRNYVEALQNYSYAQELLANVKDKASLSAVYSGRADTYFLISMDSNKVDLPDSLKNSAVMLSRARELFLSSLGLKKIIGDQNGMQHVYLKLSEVEEKLGNKEEAIFYLKNHIAIKDSLFSLENARKIAGLESQRETELKDKKIRILELEIESQRRTEIGYAILIVSLILITAVSFFLFRARHEIKLERFRNAVASDLHDEIGSTLSSISISSAVIQKKLDPDRPDLKLLVQQIGDRSDAVMEAMSDIVWTIDTKNDRFENVVNRMRALAHEVLEPINCKVDFEAHFDISAFQIDMNKRKNLYLIYKEAINNISKYASCNKVNVQIQKLSGHEILMRIEDDGIGFNSEGDHQSNLKLGGNGLRNMEARAKAMIGNLKISSEEGKGTRIELLFHV